MKASQMQKIDFYGLALSFPAVYVTDIMQRQYSGWARAQINVTSLSLPGFYSACRVIF